MFDAKMIILVMLLVWFCHMDIGSGQLTAESKSTHCTYTFNVPRDVNNGCCPSDNNTSDNDGGMFFFFFNKLSLYKYITFFRDFV